MPGSRTLSSPRDNLRWYYANQPNATVPQGFGDEDAIRAVWAADQHGPTGTSGRPPEAYFNVLVFAVLEYWELPAMFDARTRK